MTLPYRYEVVLRVEIAADGMHADGLGAVGVARRLAELVESDPQVVRAHHWPDVNYLGHPAAAQLARDQDLYGVSFVEIERDPETGETTRRRVDPKDVAPDEGEST
jgi:ATP-dependent protease HslVU (ClpYQ) ATPase subunit